MDFKVAASQYSNVGSELEQLQSQFQRVEKMGIKTISVSHVEESLFTKKTATINQITNEIKDEGAGAIRDMSKRVLNKFWRYYKTADAETQT